MADNENKLKHLEFIQKIIERMGRNSFFLKGWGITLVSAILIFAVRFNDQSIIFIAYPPIIVFWLIDSFFLQQERLYRLLYDEVRKKNPKEIDFSLNVKNGKIKLINVMFSCTQFLFYMGFIFCYTLIVYLT